MMIFKQKAFQKLVQIMKLKENQEKKLHIPVSNLHRNKNVWHGAERSNTETSRPHCRRIIVCYNLYSTTRESDKLVASKNDEIFCKITKICLLETK